MKIEGIIFDPIARKRFKGALIIKKGKIAEVSETTQPVPERLILPGFVDAHIHIESSMLVPSEFARLAVSHGTVATVSDPHEIANVCGVEGIDFMIDNGNQVPLKFFFGAPSCVPATPFETAGAEIDVETTGELLDRKEILYLSEMMNWPGVLNKDPMVMAKIQKAKERKKPVDGHAPGLEGEDAANYVAAGISTDHESFTIKSAKDKIRSGMKIAIREGSAAKNFDILIPLLEEFPDKIMFCTDDLHPDDLVAGHINRLASRALKSGYDFFDVLSSCNVRTIKHYGLPVGMLQKGDPADFIIVNELENLNVAETWIDGKCVYKNGKVLFDRTHSGAVNHFTSYSCSAEDFAIKTETDKTTLPIPVIIARDGALITDKEIHPLKVDNGVILPNTESDILKICLVNRYEKAPPAMAFIKNFGIKNGAIASSVAHDSHNIIAVGSSDEKISQVINAIMDARGGIAAIHGDNLELLPLPVGGIMSNLTGEETARSYQKLTNIAKKMGSKLSAPFMTISFMALLVIPSLKLSDKGLFDGNTFEFVPYPV